ncbi:MAG: hemerythrin domain-containing protein [Burkholderiales bacterium]
MILDDHHEQRRLFAILDEIDPADTRALGAIWQRLSAFLEIHAEAEEQLFYPELLRVGKGAGGKADAEDETEHAIRDDNQIRDAVAAVARHALGSRGWRAPVGAAKKANGDHMAEEEREGLTDFRRNAALQARHDLAVAFATFEAAHFAGVRAVDKDPNAYVEKHSPG